MRTTAKARTASSGHLLHPLDLVYEAAGVACPHATAIAAEMIPHPYRGLLAHKSDMTYALERHYGGPVGVRALSTALRHCWYQRRVLLVQEYSGRPVEMGAIRIRLDRFTVKVRKTILAAKVPLGRIMRDADLDYHSRARAFFRVVPNSDMMGVFWMREPRPLYGRRTEVILDGEKFGDIVEVLPLV